MPFPLTTIITTSNNMKSIILPFVIATLLVIDSSLTFGQSVSVATKELSWRSGELTDNSNAQKISKGFSLVVHGQSSMEFQIGSAQTLTFQITSIKGEWTDEKEDGMLEYNVRSSNDVPGKVTIERKGDSVKAWIDFTQTNKNGMNIVLKIDSIEQ